MTSGQQNIAADQDGNRPEESRPSVSRPWASSAGDVCEQLGVSIGEGLSSEQAKRRRRRKYGANRLREATARPVWRIAWEQVRSLVVIILAVAAVLSLALGNLPEGVAIFAVILVNGALGFVSEWRATRAMEALRKIGRPEARIRRNGEEKEVSAESIVPGDVAILEAGDVAPADMRLVEANGLRVDESALTGESVAVGKRAEAVEADAPLAERLSMLFKGTMVVEGSAEAVVTATGMDTELGRISRLAKEVQEDLTPLEKRLEQLGARMAWMVLGAAALIAVAGVWVGQPVRLIIATSVALGVAAVPEGLPIVANLALARGMWLMARRNALVNRLPAVETLGATDVIFTDKTGTLTENRMTVRRLVTAAGETSLEGEVERIDDPLARRGLEVGVLCCNASLCEQEDQAQGDPTEVALLRAGERFGLRRPDLLDEKPEAREVSFDPEVKMMATFHRANDGFQVAVKGAPRAVLDVCSTMAGAEGEEDRPLSDEDRDTWERQTERLAGEGLRVLALADKRADSEQAEPYEGLRLLGLAAMHDPPRGGVNSLIRSCHEAGVRVVMVTGDQPRTARAIARQVGIVDADDAPVLRGADLDGADIDSVLETAVFARFSPAQKLKLVDLFQNAGHTVAMTGDGINDSPALKKADIGVAMGQRGADAAREASDLVLQDDAFSSIVSAIRQGRVIFGNIRKSVLFMICTNVAEVLAVAAASVSGAPLPLLPLQILYLNMLTDALPAMALGVGRGDENVMRRGPRRHGEAILTRRHWLAVGGWGVGIAACVLAALAAGLLWLGAGEPTAVTVSFLTLGFAKLWFVYNLREPGSHWLRNTLFRNRWVWAAVGVCAALLVAAVYAPGLSGLLKTRAVSPAGWAVVVGLSVLPMIAGQVILFWRGRARAGSSGGPPS